MPQFTTAGAAGGRGAPASAGSGARAVAGTRGGRGAASAGRGRAAPRPGAGGPSTGGAGSGPSSGAAGARGGGARPGARGAAPSSEAAVRMKEQITTLKTTVSGLERERDFYFGKLRDVEILLQTYNGADVELVNKLFKILYATEEDFATVDETGQEVAPDEVVTQATAAVIAQAGSPVASGPPAALPSDSELVQAASGDDDAGLDDDAVEA